MSYIGKIETKQTAKGERLVGYLSTLDVDLSFQLGPAPPSDNPNAPSHTITAWNRSGVEVPVGSAWTKTMTKVGREGERFLTLSFDDPSFSKPLNVAAFLNPDTGHWDITFRRRQDRAS